VNAPEPIEQDDDEGGSHANNSQEGARRIREGAGFWHLVDSLCRPSGRIRREKAGPKGSAIKLYQKRKTEILQGKKLPEQLRNRIVRFSEIADDAESYCKANNQGFQFDAYRIGRLKEQFGNYSAEIPVEDFRRWFSDRSGRQGRTTVTSPRSLMYRLAIENKKATINPALVLKRKREDNGRVRFLNQFTPGKRKRSISRPVQTRNRVCGP
jgi:hypothetical protein